jgi:hypothetical protein
MLQETFSLIVVVALGLSIVNMNLVRINGTVTNNLGVLGR